MINVESIPGFVWHAFDHSKHFLIKQKQLVKNQFRDDCIYLSAYTENKKVSFYLILIDTLYLDTDESKQTVFVCEDFINAFEFFEKYALSSEAFNETK